MSDIPPVPLTAAGARHGSPEKLQVMADRIAAGFQLHHPDDMSCRIDPHEYHSSAFQFGDGVEPVKGVDFD